MPKKSSADDLDNLIGIPGAPKPLGKQMLRSMLYWVAFVGFIVIVLLIQRYIEKH